MDLGGSLVVKAAALAAVSVQSLHVSDRLVVVVILRSPPSKVSRLVGQGGREMQWLVLALLQPFWECSSYAGATDLEVRSVSVVSL